MAAILLTPANMAFTKVELRKSMPHVKSSHLSEVLAFALGYRTQASLLAGIGNTDQCSPQVRALKSEKLSERLASLGYSDTACTDIAAIARSSALPDRIWTMFPDKDRSANDRWFYECRRRNIPNVCIRMRRKYAELYWDCISIDSNDEAHVQGVRGTALVREMFRTYQSVAGRVPGKSEFFGSSFVGLVKDILPEFAAELADAFFVSLYEPMREKSIAA